MLWNPQDVHYTLVSRGSIVVMPWNHQDVPHIALIKVTLLVAPSLLHQISVYIGNTTATISLTTAYIVNNRYMLIAGVHIIRLPHLL